MTQAYFRTILLLLISLRTHKPSIGDRARLPFDGVDAVLSCVRARTVRIKTIHLLRPADGLYAFVCARACVRVRVCVDMLFVSLCILTAEIGRYQNDVFNICQIFADWSAHQNVFCRNWWKTISALLSVCLSALLAIWNLFLSLSVLLFLSACFFTCLSNQYGNSLRQHWRNSTCMSMHLLVRASVCVCRRSCLGVDKSLCL